MAQAAILVASYGMALVVGSGRSVGIWADGQA